jgi:hypothetical protein
VAALASERSVQRLKYTYTFDLFLQTPNVSTSSNRLEYTAFFDLAPRLGLVVGASAVQSNFSSSVFLTPPGAGAVNALPAGSGSFLAVTGDEVMSLDVARGWRAYEGAAVTEQTPLFDTIAPRTFAPGGRAGVEKAFERDALGVEGRVDYSVVENSLAPDGTALGTQHQVIGTALALWRHDWGRVLTSRVEAGALRLQRLDTGRGLWEPVGDAVLAYTTAVGDAALAAGRAVTTNPLLGQTFLTDQVSLRGAVPLTSKGEVLLAASSGYQSGLILDANAEPAARVNAFLLDAGVAWQIAPSLLVGLRYQHIEQVSDTRVPPLPLSFVRNSLMIGATVRFPPDKDMPRAYRAPQRVDRSDEIREAVEPPGSSVGQGGPNP